MAQPIWNTAAGTLGTYPSQIYMEKQLSASAVLPAVTVTYAVISGSLPSGLTMTQDGLIKGIPAVVSTNTTYTFVVRATDNYQNLRDRTFNFVISGVAGPQFTTPSGTIASINDSTWFEFPVSYQNLVSTNEVRIRLIQGQLPPGIEVNEFGYLRGYADPPILNVNTGSVVTSAVAVNNNSITCFSTTGFSVGRPVVFTGTVFGGVTLSQTYYIAGFDETTFTISTTAGGPVYTLEDATGYMTVTLPNITIGEPTIQTYSFTLKLESLLGDDTQTYSITVINQNAPASIGGPNYPPNTRVPTIFNTRPSTFNIRQDAINYDYYKLPDLTGNTYPPSTPAYIGKITSDNIFTFHILGHDFDGNELEYVFANLPLGLTGDSVTGWIEGDPQISDNTISQFSFSVAVRKKSNPGITTPNFYFSFKITNDIDGDIIWVTPENIGTLYNGSISTEKVEATSDVDLQYRLVSGSLPPNLTLFNNGEISGVVAYQPTASFLDPQVTTGFTFTVEAYSPAFPILTSQRTFTLSVYQEYSQPTDTLYIKCTPSIADRMLLRSLLDNESLIPSEALYRADDPYFGKATAVVYEHAYGIYASSFDEYIAAVTKNHYWRQLTLGDIKTAVAKNDAGEVIYEVVYSEIVDNLINPAGVSTPKEIYWPRFIPLNLGPWFTSVTTIYTSYSTAGFNLDASILTTQQFIPLLTQDQQYFTTQAPLPAYYTSLTPGRARVLYPNSLPNMRQQVGDVLGQEYNSKILPRWMTSQQADGSTTGFVPAWVICYTKPGYAEIIKNNIQNDWKNELGDKYTLNTINFKIDRFTVDKSTTFNYDKNLSPPAWTGLPSASPTPDPIDSKDFYVLFPRKNILPSETQY